MACYGEALRPFLAEGVDLAIADRPIRDYRDRLVASLAWPHRPSWLPHPTFIWSDDEGLWLTTADNRHAPSIGRVWFTGNFARDRARVINLFEPVEGYLIAKGDSP